MAKLSPAAVVCIGLLLVMALATQVTNASCPSAYTYYDCLSAAQNSKVEPDGDCCQVIRRVGSAPGGPACLCAMAKSGAFNTNFYAARSLVSKCGLPNPTGYVCSMRSFFNFAKP
ncbi:unnamed protein product [Sphagnum jensenii]|jgi:hypothetical protein|uniref:Bifunctional inhibitor/plant lipid transfer protein/seed storage helical domain-containing protein n=1 Tax=Sphagnum jensenii TaxID=128206 RepID=A0ABP0XDV6_9BRYO